MLYEVRENKISVNEFYYKPSLDTEGHEFDENTHKRYQLLIALQYDNAVGDEGLIRDLFRQEIIMHRESPTQGLGVSLLLNAYLLSRFRNPFNVWLFLDAKNANFDTHCGFDYEYLVSAGISETFNLVDQSNIEAKEDFYTIVGNSASSCHIDTDSLNEWVRNKMRYYDITRDDLESQMYLAAELKEIEILQEKIAQWKSAQEHWNKEKLNLLYSYEGLAGNISGQLAAYEQLLILETDDWSKCVLILQLTQLFLKIGNVDLAWDKIKSSQQHLRNLPDWKNVGLGRSIMESIFDIILAFNDPQKSEAKQALSWATRELNNMDNLYPDFIRKAVKSARLMGDAGAYESFSSLLRDA